MLSSLFAHFYKSWPQDAVFELIAFLKYFCNNAGFNTLFFLRLQSLHKIRVERFSFGFDFCNAFVSQRRNKLLLDHFESFYKVFDFGVIRFSGQGPVQVVENREQFQRRGLESVFFRLFSFFKQALACVVGICVSTKKRILAFREFLLKRFNQPCGFIEIVCCCFCLDRFRFYDFSSCFAIIFECLFLRLLCLIRRFFRLILAHTVLLYFLVRTSFQSVRTDNP